MDISKAKLIGKGKTADVYLYQGDAYKVYPNSFRKSWINYEYEVQKEIVKNTNLNVVDYELTEFDNIIKMQFIDGCELTHRMRKEKYKNGVEDLIKLQLEVYVYKNLNLPSAFIEFEKNIKNSSLNDSIKEKALASLEKIERIEVLCHFDFHFSNIMYDNHNYYIIDWSNAKMGNPVMDIARTFIILKQYAFRLSGKYLKMIIKKLRINEELIIQAIPLMAALRMLELDNDPFKEELLKMIIN